MCSKIIEVDVASLFDVGGLRGGEGGETRYFVMEALEGSMEVALLLSLRICILL
jgi:hypothetical protein